MSFTRSLAVLAALGCSLTIAAPSQAATTAADATASSRTVYLAPQMTKNADLREAGALGVSLTLSADDKVTGFAGCNRYFGTKTGTGANTRVANLSSTRMLCDAKTMRVESALLDALAAPSTWVIAKNGRLTIAASTTNEIVFTSETTAPEAKVPARGKYLTVVHDAPTNGVTIVKFTFDPAAQRFTVDAGCNDISGKAVFNPSASTITFSNIVSSYMLCQGQAGRAEAVITKALRGTVDYKLDGTTIVLRPGTAQELKIERDIIMTTQG